MILFRPVGLAELILIAQSGYEAFPPRLPEQPIFYLVLNLEYARQIARDWNTKSPPDYAGFVTQFEVEQGYIAKYPIQTVGGRQHQELWVPAEDLIEFNAHIVGRIEIVEWHYGNDFTGKLNPGTGLPLVLG